MARTRAQDYDAKRQAILHKSAELFAQFGYSGTSITMIADACGVSKALLYHYYPDKEAVLFDILSAHLEQLIAEVEAAIEAAPQDRLYAIAAALLDAYRDADAEHQVQIANLKLLPGERQEALRAMERRLVVLLSDAIAEAVPQIGRGPLLKPVTMSVFGMLNWHYLWFREGRGLSRAAYARLVTGLVTAGAGGALAALGMPAAAKDAAASTSSGAGGPAKSRGRTRPGGAAKLLAAPLAVPPAKAPAEAPAKSRSKSRGALRPEAPVKAATRTKAAARSKAQAAPVRDGGAA